MATLTIERHALSYGFSYLFMLLPVLFPDVHRTNINRKQVLYFWPGVSNSVDKLDNTSNESVHEADE